MVRFIIKIIVAGRIFKRSSKQPIVATSKEPYKKWAKGLFNINYQIILFFFYYFHRIGFLLLNSTITVTETAIIVISQLLVLANLVNLKERAKLEDQS